MQIIDATTPDQFEAVRQLCWEYRDALAALGGEDAKAVLHSYSVKKYRSILDQLESEHAAPGGCVKLALIDGNEIGCGMFVTLEPGTAEIKRVFVRESARGTGAGRAIMESLVSECRSRGFRRILMDTGKALTAARNLYHSMGFKERGPYQMAHKEMLSHLVLFELEL